MATTAAPKSQAGLNALLVLSAVGAAAWWGWEHLSPDRQASLAELARATWAVRDDWRALLRLHGYNLIAAASLFVAVGVLRRLCLRPWRALSRFVSSSQGAPSTPPLPKGGRGGGRANETKDTTGKAPHGATTDWRMGVDFAETPALPGGEGLVASLYFPRRALCAVLAPPKVGKSRWCADLIACIVGGVPFFGFPVWHGPVVVMCEESQDEYRDKALIAAGGLAWAPLPWPRRTWRRWKRAAVLSLPSFFCRRVLPIDVHVFCGPDDPSARTLEKFVGSLDAAAARAKKVGARLLLIDSLTFWIDGCQTQVDLAIAGARAAKSVAGRYGLCVVIIYHASEKTGKALGPTGFFSQLTQRASIAPEGGKPPAATDVRVVTWEGRFAGKAPEPWQYRMNDDGALERIGPDGEGSVPAPVLPAADAPARTPSHRHPDGEAGISAQSLAPLPLPVLTPPGPEPAVAKECAGCVDVLAWLNEREGPVEGADIAKASPGGRSAADVQRHLGHLRTTGGIKWEGEGGRRGYRYRVAPSP